MSITIHSIGHSTHSIERFIELLRLHSITAVADVRSSPYSRMNSQFNRESLADALYQVGIAYVFLGNELGARSTDRSCYRDGKARYELMAQTAQFKSGLDRVMKGAGKYRVALMCAEKDPIDCHRAILVSKALDEMSVHVRHILADGQVETQEALTARILEQLGMNSPDMFSSRERLVEDAFRARGDEIAYAEHGVMKADRVADLEERPSEQAK